MLTQAVVAQTRRDSHCPQQLLSWALPDPLDGFEGPVEEGFSQMLLTFIFFLAAAICPGFLSFWLRCHAESSNCANPTDLEAEHLRHARTPSFGLTP